VRNLIRRRPLEVEEVAVGSRRVRVPTLEEIARIKAWLCLMRNATRDYVDFAALADRLGPEAAADVVLSMDDYYADQQGAGGRRIATQVAKQLAEPLPDDLDQVDLHFYRRLDRRWQDWGAVADACKRTALRVLERAAEAGGAGNAP
jgi:RND superfamily putative drug exporter